MFADLLLLASFLSFIKSFIFVVFVVIALLLVLVVLLQEPKGGGLSGAFGGVGAETFGVQTGGVNKFTSIMAGLFLVLAVLYAAIPEAQEAAASDSYEPITIGAPVGGGPDEQPPADDDKSGS